MGENKISASGVSLKWVKSNERRKRERKKKERKSESQWLQWSVYTPEPTLIFSRSYSTEITVQGQGI